MEKKEKLIDITVLVILAGFILLWNLGTGSLNSWDEAVYAQVSREMLNSHNYMDLTWAGQPWSDKPPLYMWVTVVFYKIFGINEFSARLFSALCGMGTVVVTYLIARQLYSRRAAFCAALVLLSTWHFIWISKMGMLDAAFTFFISLSIYWFVAGTKQKIYLFLSMLSFGCVFMTKGSGALLVPIILSVYIIAAKKYNLMREQALWAGLAVTVLIVGLWHYAAFTHYGKEFIAGYFKKHLLTRVTKSVEGHGGPIYAYFKTIPNKGRPWGMVSFLVVPFALWQTLKKKNGSAHILPLSWAITTLVLFSLVRTKLNWYIVPIYPAISLLIGWAIDRIFNKKAIIFTATCAVLSLIYLTAERNIFNLDYTHDTKKFVTSLREKMEPGARPHLYDCDPSLLFYLTDKGADVGIPLLFNDCIKIKGCYIVLTRNRLGSLDKSAYSIMEENPDFVAIKVK